MNRFKTFFTKTKPTTIEVNRLKNKKYKKVWDSTKSISGGTPIELQEAYYDKDSNIYYTHKNITDLHIARQFEFNKAMQGIEWGLTAQVLKSRLEQIEIALQGDEDAREEGLRQVNDVKLRMARIPEKQMFLELAMALIYRHDENPYIYEKNIRARKLRDIANDPHLESFFLSVAWVHSKDSSVRDRLEDYSVRSFQDFQVYFTKKIMERVLNMSTG